MDPSKFPRSKELPDQSPLFWVSQKDRYLRQLLISDIEEETGKGLLVYFTDCATHAQIDHNDEPHLAELLAQCQTDEFDLLLETNGGFTDSTENVVSTLLNWGKPFRVIVPSRAKSNGTLVALAASKIVMGANSELGPIDPFVQQIPATFIIAASAVSPVDPILYQLADHAIKQTKKLATNLLTSGMMAGSNPAQIVDVVDKLASRDHFHSHGSVIDHREAQQLGLQIDYLQPESDLWRKIWLLRCMYAYDAKSRGVAKMFESSRVGQSLVYPAPTSSGP